VHPIQAISENYAARRGAQKRKVDDGAGGIIELTTKFQWFDPKARAARRCAQPSAGLSRRRQLVRAAPRLYPPTILHVTDGQSTDGTPEETADGLRQFRRKDGQALLFKCTSIPRRAGDRVPTAESDLNDEYSRCCSACRARCQALARFAGDKGYTIADGSAASSSTAIPNVWSTFSRSGTRPRLVADR